MPMETVLLILVLAAGFYMAWSIGANDVANAMGTSVGSGALTLRQAVIVAAVLEFSGAFFFGSHVSETIQSGLIRTSIFDADPLLLVYGMLASLLAAGGWLQLASYYGWPVSTTHSIVGAVVGFGAAIGGIEAIYWENVAYVATSWVISPLMGAVLSFGIFTFLRRRIFYSPDPVTAAKKITPLLVFSVVLILCLILFFRGLSNLESQFSLFESTGISLALSAVAATISYFFVRNITPKNIQKAQPVYAAEVAIELDKASKLLLRIQEASTGSVQHRAQAILNEMQSLSTTLKEASHPAASSDYATVERIFGYLQFCSACLMAFAHGANDVANAIGPLAAAVSTLTTGKIIVQTSIPGWALALGGVGIVIGLATWGWRVIETIGKKITELTPTRGFAAEFGAASTILLASRLGLPISTTHTLVGSVLGVGFARGIEALDLSTTRFIIISWLVTVPAGAALAILFFKIIQAIFG